MIPDGIVKRCKIEECIWGFDISDVAKFPAPVALDGQCKIEVIFANIQYIVRGNFEMTYVLEWDFGSCSLKSSLVAMAYSPPAVL